MLCRSSLTKLRLRIPSVLSEETTSLVFRECQNLKKTLPKVKDIELLQNVFANMPRLASTATMNQCSHIEISLVPF